MILKFDLSVSFDIEIKYDPEIGLETKPNLTIKLGYILKLNMVLELGFRVKFACIQNFKLILNILEDLKPSISSLKQPGRLAACLLEKTPICSQLGSSKLQLLSLFKQYCIITFTAFY